MKKTLVLCMAVSLVGGMAMGDVPAYQSVISSQNPNNWLKFSNNLTDNGSSATTWTNTGLQYGADYDGTVSSATKYNSTADDVSTATDVIGNSGSLSFLFAMPDSVFTADRYLFDGGQDSGADNDNFQLFWDDSEANLTVKLGNSSFDIAGSNIENNLGEWFYFAMTWDDTVNAQEGTAHFGIVGGTLSATALNPANASVMGDDDNFVIGNRDSANSGWRGSASGSNGNMDEFAIWNGTQLTSTQIQTQYAAIPEPATMSMVGLFGSVLLLIRRRFMS